MKLAFIWVKVLVIFININFLLLTNTLYKFDWVNHAKNYVKPGAPEVINNNVDFHKLIERLITGSYPAY